MLIIRESSIDELERAPNIHDILDEYAAECAIDKLPPPNPDVNTYRALEAAKKLKIIGAFMDDELIGYASILTTSLPHFSLLLSIMESLFVTKTHRGTGAGARLLKAAEQHADSMKSYGLLISAPIGGVLAEVLSKSSAYTETNRTFFRGFNRE